MIQGLAGQQKDRQTGKWKKLPSDHYGDCLKLALLGSQIAKDFLHLMAPQKPAGRDYVLKPHEKTKA